MKSRQTFLLLLLLVVAGVVFVPSSPSKLCELPPEADLALRTATTGIFYSLNPSFHVPAGSPTLHRIQILGQAGLNPAQLAVATAAFIDAIDHPAAALTACFEPRHALRIFSAGHTYDFVICYACQHLRIYKDEQDLSDLPITGSPIILNGLLTTLHLPLARQKSPTAGSSSPSPPPGSRAS